MDLKRREDGVNAVFGEVSREMWVNKTVTCDGRTTSITRFGQFVLPFSFLGYFWILEIIPKLK